MDKKCAPGINHKDGSCINVKNLKKIGIRFNKKHPNNVIDLNKNKKELVQNLEKGFKKKHDCDDQLCWLEQNFIKNLNGDDIIKNTFRPRGPSRKFDWLSTSNINDVIEQYENINEDFVFLGAVPYDFEELSVLNIGNLNFNKLQNTDKINKFGMVINLDEHNKKGSHWVSLYSDFNKNQVYFFDSFGKKPRNRIRKFINKIVKYLYKKKYNSNLPINTIINDIKKKNITKTITNMSKFDIKYNKIQHQIKNSECGVYSINFIIRLLNGESFNNITKNITNDDDMNNCRKTYFRN